MQTNLPDLPFPDYGDVVLAGLHSAVKESRRTYPRTDLAALTHWDSFGNDIHAAIQSATSHMSLTHSAFRIAAWTKKKNSVESEDTIRSYASVALHAPVEQVAHKLGVHGSFISPGVIATIGAPDFSWIVGEEKPHPKLIVEYKTWWAADLLNLPAVRESSHRDTLGQQSIDALEQIYGYMVFNNNKYGILTNWKRAWFLRRADIPGRKTLECYCVELDRRGHPISMLKAWVGMILLADNDWFYAPPSLPSAPLVRNFGAIPRRRVRPVNGQYRCLTLNYYLCRFDLSSARCGPSGCAVTTQFLEPSNLRDLAVVCKIVDALRYPVTGEYPEDEDEDYDPLEDEARAYAALKHLQGQVIPTFYGFYEVWGILKLLALEPVSDAIPEGEKIDQDLRMKMKAALGRIHDAGYVHGDITRRNFTRTQSGNVFLVDLERCRRAQDQAAIDNEMKQVDKL